MNNNINIVLVSVGNFQEYILDNIHQLIRLGHENIWVLTNSRFFERFSEYTCKIKLIAIELLDDSFRFYENSKLDKRFREGFWTLTSLRFFYIYEFMRVYNISNVIHLENDVLIYYHCDTIIERFDKTYVYLPFDTYSRNIASIMFIPSASVFKSVLDHYDFNTNDMENFSNIMKVTGLIRNLPIFIGNDLFVNSYSTSSDEYSFVTSNFERFGGFIFDAAAIGQYLGGVDPRNISGDSTGFVNETCIIKYNTYSFVWKLIDDIKRPFIIIDGNKIPIFNLHIHSKNLLRFI
jgi:hypothetical protein